ncbi:uncharacterized protein C8A04DRAFT_14152 [Dichotomopilus funicola]|uniref:Uncharacterized protein n=1 Tax=Dichotomopilus funicola TaxID=1934379 RepID=A0AAN6UY19_9PEZI|nr:hypothetical protein C8A04DRAFT_14152 [Dichotomopilus funicola]
MSAALGFFPSHKAAAVRLNSVDSETPDSGSPPPEYRQIWTSAPRYPPPSIPLPTAWPEPPARPSPPVPETPHPEPETRVEIVPKHYLTDKSKPSDILYIDTSPMSRYLATKHSNKLVKIWSTHTNALHTTIKTTSYVQPRPRSREYFVRSHAILSEQNTLIGITTHFGLTLEIWDFSKPGTGNAKKVQTIDEAHRWAASPRDAVHNNHAGLAVYRPKYDRIDCFYFSRHPGAKTPFYSDPSLAIELLKANLPFLPTFPELAYSSDPDNPILVAAAGPRPGDPLRANGTILVAWQLKPVATDKLTQSPTTPHTPSLPLPSTNEDRHKPYRVCVPDHPALRTALPASLAVHGHTAVSVWIPASKSATDVNDAAVPPRLLLLWDLPTNTTRLFPIPGGNAQVAVAPDCGRLVYYDARNDKEGEVVVLDLKLNLGPDNGLDQGGGVNGGKSPTALGFSADRKMLLVGDTSGSVGVYGVEDVKRELGVGNEIAWVDVLDQEIGSVGRAAGKVRVGGMW